MKLFYFKPDSYGEEALVCAETEEQAINALRANVDEEAHAEFRQYRARNVEDMINRRGYTLIVLDPGKVVWTEVS